MKKYNLKRIRGIRKNYRNPNNMKRLSRNIREQIKYYRKKGISQRTLAIKLNVSRTVIQKYGKVEPKEDEQI